MTIFQTIEKSSLALELEKQLAEAAKFRRRATQKNDAGRAVQQKIAEQEKGQARDQAAKIAGMNRQYVSDAKKLEQDAPEVLEHVKQGKLSAIGGHHVERSKRGTVFSQECLGMCGV